MNPKILFAETQPIPKRTEQTIQMQLPVPPLPNYTLSTVCPACGSETVRRACKVRCDNCGFMWDCSEL